MDHALSRRQLAAALAAAPLIAIAGRTQAQAYPVKPIRFIVPYVAGGTTDLVARLVVAPGTDRAQAETALHRAEHGCLISNSLKAAVRLHAHIDVGRPSYAT